jgi:hypothetical protein
VSGHASGRNLAFLPESPGLSHRRDRVSEHPGFLV